MYLKGVGTPHIEVRSTVKMDELNLAHLSMKESKTDRYPNKTVFLQLRNQKHSSGLRKIRRPIMRC
jgi:hypothetical protein